jgi:ubiquitin fusion degradation protein 1
MKQIQKGDKILLPPSAFESLARLQVDYPMLFQLTAGDRVTHSGVLEFTAEEGCVYIPFWMMQNLLIEEGAVLSVKNVSLPKATFVKLQPQSVDFLEISNPRAVLEHALRNYSCVTLHDIIQLPYNGKNYHFQLKDVQPSPAACIIETDCNVDFDAPVGYQEPDYKSSVSNGGVTDATATTASSNGHDAGMNGNKPSNGESSNGSSTPPRPHNGVRIVNGVLVRPNEGSSSTSDGASTLPLDLLAARTGGTGIQPNAATLPIAAPEVEYWAVAAGSGARLDGKAATPLKDKQGQELDVATLRANAAAKRAAEAEAAKLAASNFPLSNANAAPVQRKSKVGNKYSRLKQTSAFQGDANQLHKK